MAYGLTSNLTLATSLPLCLEGAKRVEHVGGRVKFRFFRRDLPGAQVAASFVSGVVQPTRSGGSTGYVLGLNAGYEGRRWYGFLDGHALLKSGSSGHSFFFNSAAGIRPFDTGYRSVDWVFYLELNYEEKGKKAVNRRKALFLSPTFFITYRNAALRGGYQFPVVQKVESAAPSVQGRFALALEFHY